ncbi:hypothetical protein K7X08_038057 [Anisodus acutangulus]|uniref:Cytochrome b6-f complex subunit 7 n=1 Tax=Anisodus acutangulus TaxID=402998 RepID=A0A9Q1N178_9SOLA|nr:hypothetical protein K7X08_038057 [Anisodus acutangulus]
MSNVHFYSLSTLEHFTSHHNQVGGQKAMATATATLSLATVTLAARVGTNSSLRTTSSQGKGGALSSTCKAAVEIFKIASIIPGLVLVGVSVGFVLLRIEASVEESD